MLLDARGISCSTGSACTAGVAQPSHVLLAMGADHARARGSLRFTFGRTSSEADVEALGAVIGEVVERARRAGRQPADPRLARPPLRPRSAQARERTASPSVSRPGRLRRSERHRERPARARGDVGWCRLGGGRGARGRRGPRGDRRSPGPFGQPAFIPVRGERLLHARGCSGRQAGGRRDRHPLLRVGHGRALRRGRGRRLRCRVRARSHAQSLLALQREDQVRSRA